MSTIIKCMGLADGRRETATGQWLKSFDHEAHNGRGEAVFTRDPKEAMKFPSKVAAFNFWRKVPDALKVRPDGKPNRPLTAWHMLIEEFDDREFMR